MNHAMMLTFKMIGRAAGLLAIASLLIYIVLALRDFFALQDIPPEGETIAWGGLLLLAVYMACEVGRIGFH